MCKSCISHIHSWLPFSHFSEILSYMACLCSLDKTRPQMNAFKFCVILLPELMLLGVWKGLMQWNSLGKRKEKWINRLVLYLRGHGHNRLLDNRELLPTNYWKSISFFLSFLPSLSLPPSLLSFLAFSLFISLSPLFFPFLPSCLLLFLSVSLSFASSSSNLWFLRYSWSSIVSQELPIKAEEYLEILNRSSYN